MKLFQYEMKKIVFYHWGLLIFVVFLLLQVGLLFAGDTPNNLEAQKYRESYLYYLEQVDGAWTQEKEDYLKEEVEVIQEANEAVDSAWEAYYDGELTKEELQSEIAPYEEILEREDGFNVVYNQYLYICVGKDNRFFVETNGWSGLLDDGMLDFPLLLAMLLLIVPVFCSEYVCQMDLLSLTTKNGQKSYLKDKLLAAGLIIFVLCLSAAAVRYGFYALRYGLPHGGYPIQSVEAFGSCTKNVTLMQAFLLLFASRLFGGLYLAALILAVSAVSRQYGLSVFIPTASILLPWGGLSEQLQYRSPLPLPFLLGVGFLKGSEYTTDTVDSDAVLTFQEVGGKEFIWLLGGCCVILCVCVWVIWWKHHTTLSKYKKHRKAQAIALLLVLFLFSGCSADTSLSGTVCYNSRSIDCYTGNYHIYYDYEEAQPMVEFLDTGECIPLYRDALRPTQDIELGNYFFVEGDTVYYSAIITDSSREYTLGNGNESSVFSLRKIDLTTFEETVIYEWNEQGEVLGITLDVSSASGLFSFNNQFFLRDNFIYVLMNNKLYRVDLRTSDAEILDVDPSGNIAFDGQYIYYTDSREIFYRMDTDTDEIVEWTDAVASDFCLVDDTIYYINRQDHEYLYKMDLDGSNQQLVLDQVLMSVIWNGATLQLTDINWAEYTFDVSK